MATNHHKPEETLAKLQDIGTLVGQGKAAADAVRSIEATEPSTTGRAWDRVA